MVQCNVLMHYVLEPFSETTCTQKSRQCNSSSRRVFDYILCVFTNGEWHLFTNESRQHS